MSVFDRIRQMSKDNPGKVILPESEEDRVIAAANFILEYRLSKLIIIGDDRTKRRISAGNAADVEFVEPNKFSRLNEFITLYHELRRHRGMTPDEAGKTVRENRVVFAALMVRSGMADAFVAGAHESTPNVVRGALHCLEQDASIGSVSGAFVMELPRDRDVGENGAFVFADCGVNPDPTPAQLASTAIASAALFEKVVGATPRVAFLSYSSKGSASGPLVDKVVEAVRQTNSRKPGLIADGEFQVDSAIVPEVARIKCPTSKAAGRANVLIFPDLNSGNISYKLTQRLASARAVGPLLLGFTRPASDLSRGCGVDDIVDAVSVMNVLARKGKK